MGFAMAATDGKRSLSTTDDSNKKMDNFNKRRGDDSENDPPNSRLFIVCDKSITEEDFREAFSPFGSIEDIWIVRDKSSGEPKGITYIKFAKTSQAIGALESMNGKFLKNSSKPLKVLVASNRADGSKREPNEGDRLVRLFVVVPKSFTKQELEDHFREFGDISDTMIVKDRKTGESKGFAYIRYQKASHAARAFENCDKSFKAVFADPRPVASSKSINNYDHNFDPMNDGNCNFMPGNSSSVPGHEPFQQIKSFFGDGGRDHGRNGDSGRLHVYAPDCLNQQQLWRLFDLVPDFEYCELRTRNYGPRRDSVVATVKYRSHQAAMWAKEKFNNFEYPPGFPLIVRAATDDFDDYGNRNSDGNFMPHGPPIVPNDIAKLVDAFTQAQSIIQAAGLNHNSRPKPDIYDPSYCSVRLPSPQPLAYIDSAVAGRLFIVCSPSAPPLYALKDVFGRFGGLIDVYILPGKNCGFVKYAQSGSAEEAIKVLHGQEVMGKRLKVMHAEPLERNHSGQKRPRTEEAAYWSGQQKLHEEI